MNEADRAGGGRRIAVYGKGGVGKSTIVATLALHYVLEGRRTLQVGCDPKADSCLLHVDPSEIRPVMPGMAWLMSGSTPGSDAVRPHIVRGRTGVDCLEAGGTDPGKGCGGLAISMLLKLLDHSPCFREYDVVIYDVLGDVVCGGFSVPMRAGKARDVYIVVSGDVSSLYAANSITRAVVNNRASGVRLAGLVVNRMRDDAAIGPDRLAEFARRLGTRIAGAVPFDPLVTEAEARGGTAAELFPDSDVAAAYRRLFEATRDDDGRDFPVPTPMPADDLLAFLRGRPSPRSTVA